MKSIDEIRQESVSYFTDQTMVPDLMTEEEVIKFLRIPDVTSANDYHNVIANLIRFRDLPRIHICKRALYPKKAVLEWIDKETIKN